MHRSSSTPRLVHTKLATVKADSYNRVNRNELILKTIDRVAHDYSTNWEIATKLSISY